MNRSWLIIVALALVMTSCSYDAVKDAAPQKEICFDACVTTKGSEIKFIESFYATAYSLSPNSPDQLDDISDLDLFFENVLFEKDGGSFYSDPAYYWPDVRTLIFVLWTPSLDEMGMEYSFDVVLNEENGEIQSICFYTGLEPDEDISKQKDFLWALAIGNSQTGIQGLFSDFSPHVEFVHALSGIEITAKGIYGSRENYTYSVKGIRIGNVYGKGDFDILSWTNLENYTCYECIYDEPKVFKDSEEVSLMPSEEDYAFLIPQELTQWDPDNPESSGAYISVLLKVTKTDGNGESSDIFPTENYEQDEDGYAWTAVPLNTEKWKVGTKYTYVLDFSTGYGSPEPTPLSQE